MPVLLNTAPALAFPQTWWEWISILVANEIEATALSGMYVDDRDSALEAVRRLRDRCEHLIVTLGDQGVIVSTAVGEHYLPAHHVEVVSTLGAGDAFVGVFAAEFCRARDILRCAEIANVAAASSVMAVGAQRSYRNRADIYGHPTLGPLLTQAVAKPGANGRSPSSSVSESRTTAARP